MPNKIRNSLTHFLGAVACLVLLTSCGGGGGGGSTATMPTAQVPEMINGIAVPPEPNPTINNATLVGVDSNNNGVRDDVERKLAANFVSMLSFEKSITTAQIVQRGIAGANLTESDFIKLMCDARLNEVESVTLNSKTRDEAYQKNQSVNLGFTFVSGSCS